MNRTLLIGLVLLTAQSSSKHAVAQGDCSTELGTPLEIQAFLQRHQTFLQNQSLQRSSALGDYKWIPVHFHILRASDGSGGISLSDARAALGRCITAFAPTNIRFFECGYQYHNNDSYYDEFDKATEEVGMISAYNIDSVANVYIVDDLVGGIGGFAKFPGSFTSGLSVNNYTVVDRTNLEDSEGTTLQHEFGHFFDLPHTHETVNGTELVNGSNCATAGDGFCDTPADPDLGANNGLFECCPFGCVSVACDYIGLCEDTNGDSYSPSVSNIMSYSGDCRTSWSPLQIAKMNETVGSTGPDTRKRLNCANCSSSAAGLPVGILNIYLLGEYYHKNEIVSDADLSGAISVSTSSLTLIATERVRLLPGFDFSALDPDLDRFRAIIDPCGYDSP